MESGSRSLVFSCLPNSTLAGLLLLSPSWDENATTKANKNRRLSEACQETGRVNGRAETANQMLKGMLLLESLKAIFRRLARPSSVPRILCDEFNTRRQTRRWVSHHVGERPQPDGQILPVHLERRPGGTRQSARFYPALRMSIEDCTTMPFKPHAGSSRTLA